MTQLNLLELYAEMVRMRRFEEACLSGVPTREIHGEVHLGMGQEAIGAAMVGLLTDEDALVSTHRNHLHALAKGVDPYRMLAEIFERSTGLCGGFGGHMHLFDLPRRFSTTGIVGATLPVALGHAYAARLRGSDAVAVGVSGDGGANTGGFHESLNLAGAWKLPGGARREQRVGHLRTVRPVLRHAHAGRASTCLRRVGTRVDGLDVEAVGTGSPRRSPMRAPVWARPSSRRPATASEVTTKVTPTPTVTSSTEDSRREGRDPLTSPGPGSSRKASQPLSSTELEARIGAEIEELLERVRRDPSPDAATALDHVFVGGAA